jgi:hypothetical protein
MFMVVFNWLKLLLYLLKLLLYLLKLLLYLLKLCVPVALPAVVVLARYSFN